MGEVKYPRYRTYVESRILVNNAVMAMLAGSRLAGHSLQLNIGTRRTLSELFPAVEHIERFDLQSDKARELLQNADHHLASVTIPYALATHEDFIMSGISMLKDESIDIQSGGNRIKAWNMHEVLFKSAKYECPAQWLQSFHLLREMRNCIIHAGGRTQEKLIERIEMMGAEATAGWQNINQQLPEEVAHGGRLMLTAEHIFTAFAVTKRLGREVNAALASGIPREGWARFAVDDFQLNTSKIRNSSGWRRGLLGYARQNYQPIELEEAQLEQAARQQDYWTLDSWK